MSDIAVHRDGATQILRFNRPGKMNALTGAMYDALCDALEAGEKDTEVSVHVFVAQMACSRPVTIYLIFWHHRPATRRC